MEIFIFKFPYIANHEIISVGLAVIFVLFVVCLADTILVRVCGGGGRGGGWWEQGPTLFVLKYPCSHSAYAVFVWKFVRTPLSYDAITTVGGLSGASVFLSLDNSDRKLFDLSLKTALVHLTKPGYVFPDNKTRHQLSV